MSLINKIDVRTKVAILAGVLLLLTVPLLFAIADNTLVADFERDVDQHLYISDSEQAGLNITGDLTLETWMKIESMQFMGILAKWAGAGQEMYRLSIENEQGHIEFRVHEATFVEREYTWHNAAVVGEWQHIAVTWDASADSAILYINGRSQGEGVKGGVQVSAIQVTDTPFTLGSDINSGPNAFDGQLDDVRVWNVIRTPAQIKSKYKKEIDGTHPNLMGYWKLNGDGTDSSTNGNDLYEYAGPITYLPETPFKK